MSYILDTKLQTQTIFLNSLRAASRNPYNFNFSNPIISNLNMRMLISLEDFTISNCFNNVNSNNNILAFTSDIYGKKQIIIPEKMYNINSFVTQINSQLLQYEITAVYDKSIFKLSFVSICPFRIRVSTCESLIGVSKDNNNEFIYPIESTATPSYTIYMPSCIDFSGSPYLFLKCNNLLFSNINSYGTINNCMARIPINSPYGYKIYYRPTETIKFISSVGNINNLSFSLEDAYNNPLDIGGNEFQMLIKINYIYTPIEKGDYLEGSLDHFISQIPKEEEVDENVLE